MGSVLSSAYAALCSMVGALLDKAEMWRLMAAYPQLRDMPAEARENLRQWIRDENAKEEAREAAASSRSPDPETRVSFRCRHPRAIEFVADKNKVAKSV